MLRVRSGRPEGVKCSQGDTDGFCAMRRLIRGIVGLGNAPLAGLLVLLQLHKTVHNFDKIRSSGSHCDRLRHSEPNE